MKIVPFTKTSDDCWSGKIGACDVQIRLEGKAVYWGRKPGEDPEVVLERDCERYFATMAGIGTSLAYTFAGACLAAEDMVRKQGTSLRVFALSPEERAAESEAFQVAQEAAVLADRRRADIGDFELAILALPALYYFARSNGLLTGPLERYADLYPRIVNDSKGLYYWEVEPGLFDVTAQGHTPLPCWTGDKRWWIEGENDNLDALRANEAWHRRRLRLPALTRENEPRSPRVSA